MSPPPPSSSPPPRDLSDLSADPRAVAARRSGASRWVALAIGWGGLALTGVGGGALWSTLAADGDRLFVPMVSAYVIFVFWLYAPTGYRCNDEAIEVLRPRGPWRLAKGRVVGVFAGAYLLSPLAGRTGAQWLEALPETQERPAGARLWWIDPDLPAPPAGAPPAVSLKEARAPWLALPLGGLYLIWGGAAGRFWSPGIGVHIRHARCYRPRLGLWVRG